MADYVDAAAVATAAFFVVLAAVLLVRYRQASERITESSELNHDLWRALEGRLKKQDERILDLMGRVEVLQARALAASQPSGFVIPRDTRPLQPVPSIKPPPEIRPTAPPNGKPGDTEMTAIELLGEGAKSTIEIKEAIGLTREHTARTMKALFDKGLVTRDESEKPFVYQLTEKGRSYLSQS